MEKWLLVYVAPRIRDNTLTGYRAVLKHIYAAVGNIKLARLTETADLERPQKPSKRQFHKPSPKDWQTLVDYQSSLYYCWRWIILTEFVTGTRMSELLALQWADFSVQRGGRLS